MCKKESVCVRVKEDSPYWIKLGNNYVKEKEQKTKKSCRCAENSYLIHTKLTTFVKLKGQHYAGDGQYGQEPPDLGVQKLLSPAMEQRAVLLNNL